MVPPYASLCLHTTSITSTQKKILKMTTFHDPSFAEENEEDLEWHHQLPFDKADVH
jgi:hypothetical protein